MFRWPSTLDASPILSTSKSKSAIAARRIFADDLVSHLRQHGFARVRNHGVVPSTIKGLFTCHRDFFSLPLAAKLSVRHPGGESPARGYSPWAYEKTAILRPDLHADPSLTSAAASSTSSSLPFSPSPSRPASIPADSSSPLFKTLLDAREQFAIGPPDDTEFPTPQLADGFLPGFNEVTRTAYTEIGDACRRLVDAIEVGLGAPASSISNPTAGGRGAELNLNFYPEVERGVLEDDDDARPGTDGDVSMRRIWPHSDLGVTSALFQDGVGESGLELEARQLPGSKFAPLSIEEEGDMVLLVSDTLERWTNGYLRAALHRVGLPPSATPAPNGTSKSGVARIPERRSAVMFFRAPPTADLGPLPYFVSAENPARYEHVTAGEYLKRHNRRLY